MASSDENPFAKWDLPPDPVVDEDADNPFREFKQQPKAAAAAPAPSARSALRGPVSPLDTVPLAADDPRQGPTYDPDVERLKKGIRPGIDLNPLAYLPQSPIPDELQPFTDATVRAGAKAITGLPFLPIDAAVGVRNFINQGDFSKDAWLRSINPLAGGSPAPGDYEGPSQRLEELLNQYTEAPTTTTGRVAEAVNSAILGARLPTGLPTTPAVAPPRVNPTPGELAIVAGERHHVPVGYSDITRSPFIKKLDVLSENVPITGPAGARETQMQAAKRAAQELTGRYSQVAQDEAQRFARPRNPARPEIDDLAADVPVTMMQVGMQRRLDALKGSAGVLFDRAARLLDPAGNVTTPRFNQAIGRAINAQAQRGSMADEGLVNLLERLHDAPVGNFTVMRRLRSDIGDLIRDSYAPGQNKAIGTKGVEALSAIRTALEQDMQAFAQGVGGRGYNAWRDANNFWRTNLVPFKEVGFSKLVKTAEPEQAWRYLMQQGGVDSRAERMYNGLDTAGRAAVRAGVLQDALQQATHVAKSKQLFSPAKFAKYMEDHEKVINQFFHGNERQEIDGFTNLMRHVERAGQFMENPPTGNRVIAAMGAAAIGAAAPTQTAATLGLTFAAAGAARFLFQSKAGRNLLMAASKLKPGSPAMHEISQQARRILSQGAVQASGATQNAPPDEDESEGDHLRLEPVGDVSGEPNTE
jgi:hypothetical protein